VGIAWKICYQNYIGLLGSFKFIAGVVHFDQSCSFIRSLQKLEFSRFKRKYLAAVTPIYLGNTSKMKESHNITWDLKCTYNAYIKFITHNLTMGGGGYNILSKQISLNSYNSHRAPFYQESILLQLVAYNSRVYSLFE